MNRTGRVKVLFPVLLAAGITVLSAGGDPALWPGEERLNERQPPPRVMDAIGLRPGMTIADIGSGRGRYTVWFADRVGPGGRVLANDIDGQALSDLRRRCRDQGLANVEIVRGEVADPRLPAASVDIAFMINVYHHLDQPVRLVRNTLPCLRPGGVVAIVECDPAKGGFNPDHGTPKAEVLRQLGEAGLVDIEVVDPPWLEHDYIYIGKPGKTAPAVTSPAPDQGIRETVH